MKPDNAGRILGEARDVVARTASFFCLRESDGTPLWENRRFEEPWWIGIEDASGDTVFFHGFGKPDMPQHLGIIACDIDTGELRWQEPALTFLFCLDGFVYASEQRFDAMVFHKLDATTGERIENLGSEPASINALRATLNDDDEFAGYSYPEPYTPAHPQWERAAALTDGILDAARVAGNLDILERDGIAFIAWHQASEAGGLTQHFVVRSTEGRILFRDTILDHADAPGMDSFFIKDDLLFYVRNRGVLTAHSAAGIGL